MIRCALGRSPRSLWMVACALLVGSVALPNLSAQSPGEFPSVDAIQRSADAKPSDADGLPVSAYMVLDNSGNLVYIPGMTYERLRELESGADSTEQLFVFEPLEIKATATGGRAELDLSLEVTVEPTDGRYVSIPLKMGNFFLLRAPEFTSKPASATADSQFVQPSEDGLVLKVRSTKRRKLTMRMSMAALVQTGPNRLDFQLPNLPTNVHLETDLADAVGEVIGSGSEVFQSNKSKNGGTRFDVATGGGSLTLQWTAAERAAGTALLESDSVVLLNWGTPKDQPTASVTLSLRRIRDLRGPIESFELDLPPGAKLKAEPVLDAKDQVVQQSAVRGKPNRVLITIPEQERSQRIAVRLELQLANVDASENKPLEFVVPKVVGAVRQQGEITIQTSSDYRLRWRSSPWVRSFLAAPSVDGGSNRSYQFNFDRGDFVLPIWLSANKRQLLVTSESLITVRDALATMEMEIQFKGLAADSRSLQLDLAGWRLQAVIDADTDDTLPWFDSDQKLSIEMNSSVEDLPPVKIFAQRQLFGGEDENRADFVLPRILQNDDSLSIGTTNVTLQSIGRSVLVVNLDQSVGIERSTTVSEQELSRFATSRFRILNTESSPRIVGALVKQPPQITLESKANISLSGDQLTTVVDWGVSPQVDLAGVLPVRVPRVASIRQDVVASDVQRIAQNAQANSNVGSQETPLSVLGDAPVSAADGETTTEEFFPASSSVPTSWTVTVDGVAAQLLSLGGDRFELVSDRLGIQPVAIRWREIELVPPAQLTDKIQTIQLPVPALADVTVRGDIVVSMQGDSQTNLLAADTASDATVEFQSVPDRVRVRMTKFSRDENDLSIRKAVLRSAVGVNMRHEQLLALTQGGDTLDLGLPVGLGELEVEALVDKKAVAVSRENNQLRVSLPGDSETHRVDLRIWVTEPSGGLVVNIKPILQLPLRVGRVYWQVITPHDSHVIWAAPTVGRAMDWRFQNWRLERKPLYTDTTLSQWVGVESSGAMPPGNRYLYIGSDIRSFSARTLSRATIWLLVGSAVLAFASMLSYVPASRSPLTAVVGAVLFAGLIALAPDAAVLAGQLTMVALVLVIVMVAISSLVRQPSPGRRNVRRSASPSNSPSRKSTQTYQVGGQSNSPNETVTATVSPSEASS